jgi:hypothetical protein
LLKLFTRANTPGTVTNSAAIKRFRIFPLPLFDQLYNIANVPKALFQATGHGRRHTTGEQNPDRVQPLGLVDTARSAQAALPNGGELMRSIIIAVIVAFAFATTGTAAPQHITQPRSPVCNPAELKPCGNICIPKGLTCRIHGAVRLGDARCVAITAQCNSNCAMGGTRNQNLCWSICMAEEGCLQTGN